METIRTTLLVVLVGLFLTAGAVGTASASSGEYVVDLECPEISEAVLDSDLDVSEDYLSCMTDREEAEMAASAGFRTMENLHGIINQIGGFGETLEDNRFETVQGLGDSITDWADEQHERLDAEKQALVEDTALEKRSEAD